MRRCMLAFAVLVVFGTAPAAASAREQTLTLYSPKIHSEPYVGYQNAMTLKPDGQEAPSQAGYITSFVEQVLVDSKRPDAKPLPIGKMMIHHLLYFAPHRVDQFPGSCLGLIGLRGEEEPLGHYAKPIPAAVRARYGINNRTATGQAPNWILVAMVMNHYARAKDFYVRTKVRYTTDPREPVSPIILGDCTNRLSGNLYDVPGGGGPGSSFVDRGSWRVPDGFNGRIILAQSHQHGGARYQTLGSRTCGRRLLKARAYYGRPNHPYNTVRPILHEPGPIGNGTFASAKGIPITAGEVLTRRAVHDDSNLHVAAMGFWWLLVAKDDRAKRCGPVPRDLRQINRPPRFAKLPDYDLRVPQLAKPQGPVTPFDGNPITLGDDFFRPDRISARVGETISWRFGGALPHSVSVANGPRGFSSLYYGRTSGVYSFRPRVRGIYRLTCLVHPTRMAQTLVVR